MIVKLATTTTKTISHRNSMRPLQSNGEREAIFMYRIYTNGFTIDRTNCEFLCVNFHVLLLPHVNHNNGEKHRFWSYGKPKVLLACYLSNIQSDVHHIHHVNKLITINFNANGYKLVFNSRHSLALPLNYNSGVQLL